jgi:hypothetical protein
MRNRFWNIETWTSEDFEAYARYLGQWPLINYALESLKEHLDSCSQDGNLSRLVSGLVKQLTNNQSSYLFGSWLASNLGGPSSVPPQRGIAKYFPRNVLRDAARAMHPEQITFRATAEKFKYETLNAAATIGLLRVAKALLITCTRINGDAPQKTPLMKSAAKGHEATVRLLLDLGMDRGAKDKSGQTALHHAVQNGYEATTRLLIQQGVPKQTEDNQGRTAMHLAILKL